MDFRGRKALVIWILLLTVSFGCGSGEEVGPTDTPTRISTNTPLPTDVPMRHDGETVYRDIPYASGENKSQTLSVFFPGEASSLPDKTYPVIFLVHGWTVEKEDDAIVYQVIPFARDLGYVVVSTDYRDGPTDGGDPWNALGDITCALAWVFANADDFGFDVSRMVAFGHSRGGTLASVLATADENSEFFQDCPHQPPEEHPFLGVITYGSDMGVPGPGLFFGSEDFGSLFEKELTYGEQRKKDILERSQALSQVPPLEWATNDSFTKEQRKLAMIYPVYWIDPSDPPFLVMWGEKDIDPNWSEKEATAFVEQLESVEVPASFVLLPGATHASLGNPLERDDSVWQEPVKRFLSGLLENE